MKRICFAISQIITCVLRTFLSYINGGEKCVVCNKKTYLYPICNECLKTKFNVRNILDEKRCSYCGRKLISTFETCIQCRENKVLNHVDKMFPLFSYRLWNKELMFMWKTEEVRSLSILFSKFIADVLLKLNIYDIVPVPPRPGKIKEKGWDQMEDISRYLEYRYGFKIHRILERRTTVQQKKLDRLQRLDTIDGAYQLIPKIEMKYKDMEKPKLICIIDDVCTTGSTIECCGKILKQAGFNQVYAITLFSVD